MSTDRTPTVTYGPKGPTFTGFAEMTLDEWRAEASRRFGSDVRTWRFVCPICGGTQSLADFEALPADSRPKDPSEVFYYSCIGRWIAGAPRAFGGKPTAETHCDYTLGGLFCIAKRVVRGEDGHQVPVFEFAEPSV